VCAHCWNRTQYNGLADACLWICADSPMRRCCSCACAAADELAATCGYRCSAADVDNDLVVAACYGSARMMASAPLPLTLGELLPLRDVRNALTRLSGRYPCGCSQFFVTGARTPSLQAGAGRRESRLHVEASCSLEEAGGELAGERQDGGGVQREAPLVGGHASLVVVAAAA
jgi:hypothetical protein